MARSIIVLNINAKLIAVASIVVLAAGNWTFAQVEPASPHWSKDGCDACHTGTPTKESFTLITTDTEMLCQSCHTQPEHQSFANGPDGLPDGNASRYLLGRNCMNCHTQVHGSNHPSGSRLMR